MKAFVTPALQGLIDRGQPFSTNEAREAAGLSDNTKNRRAVAEYLEALGIRAERKRHGRGTALVWTGPSPNNNNGSPALDPDRRDHVLTVADFDRIAAIAAEIVHGAPQPRPDYEPRTVYEETDLETIHRTIRIQELDIASLQEQRGILGMAAKSFIERYFGALLSAGLIRAADVDGHVRDELAKLDGFTAAARAKYEALRDAPLQEPRAYEATRPRPTVAAEPEAE